MARTNTKVIAEICLYGTTWTGAGWLAKLAGPGGKLLGDGEPRRERSFTEAVWLACDAIRTAGATAGRVVVFAPGGERMAVTDVNHPGYYGDLVWGAAPVYEVTVEQILAGAE